MRALVIRATGGLDQLQQSDVPDPPGSGSRSLGPRQVRVAPRAAALNHLDLFVVRGLPHEYRFPHIMGADGAGVVDAVGSDVRSVRPGDRVMINPGIADYTCEYCRAGEQSLCRGYGILGEHFPGTMAQYVVVPEQNVAIIPTSATPLTWPEAAAFSLVTLPPWPMVVTRARLVTCGSTTGAHVSLDLRRVFWHQWSILGSTMGNDAEYREIVRLLGAGELRPIVDRVFPFTEARAAFERLERGEQLGKIAIEISS